MSSVDWSALVAERNAALRSLNEGQIRAYGAKYGEVFPVGYLAFWGAVHKARVHCLSGKEREKSYQWLVDHGVTTEV